LGAKTITFGMRRRAADIKREKNQRPALAGREKQDGEGSDDQKRQRTRDQ
jgi:hypothetical protein